MIATGISAWLVRPAAGMALVVSIASIISIAPGAMARTEGEVTAAITDKDSKVGRHLDSLSREVATSPTPLGWRDLGIVQCRLGLYKDALASLDRAASSLDDDFYLHAYRGLTAEMLKDFGAAEAHYERAAGFATPLAEALATRSRLAGVRARIAAVDAEGDFGTGPVTVAILAPVDLGGGAEELAPVLGAVLHLGLGQVEGVDALGPSDTQRWLAADGRGASDLDDQTTRDRVAKGLARKGIETVLASSFLLMESGEVHYRLALIPVGADGVGETASVNVTPGQSGSELLPLAAAVAEICTYLAVTPPANGASIPRSLEAGQAYHAGLVALERGGTPAAHESMCRAQELEPDVADFTGWCEDLAEILAQADVPLATDVSEPRVTVVEALRKIAVGERKRRRFDDL